MKLARTAFFAHTVSTDLALVPFSPEIVDDYHELHVRNHDRIRLSEPAPALPPSRAEAEALLLSSGQAWLRGTAVPVAIAHRSDGLEKLVGAANLRINAYLQSAEVGIWIDAEWEGRGIAKEALSVLIDYGFNSVKLARISLRTASENTRCRALAKGLGFSEEGTHRKAIPLPGGRSDEVVYGLLAEDWDRRR
ncbi:GNAT family protein [Streptomyces sp. 378]|uniref:GNAT family N-acetyltransferase n=1 Tax=Streptomyces sp. 378 TaxID=3049412 RepID=UPI0024C348B0|nr:GNAT family protein [Streptomyces sp. 378]MDK1349086.1 GNAT family protein [Streptomyces sp. 378]